MKTTKAPVTKANITMLSKSESIYLGPTLALEKVNELTSFSNYVAISRALNPTRRIFLPDTFAQELAAWANLGEKNGETQRKKRKLEGTFVNKLADEYHWFGDASKIGDLVELMPFFQLLSVLHPAHTHAMVMSTAVLEEELAMRKYNGKDMDDLGSTTSMGIQHFFRFYKGSDRFMMEKPIGPILDAAFLGFLYNGKQGETPMKELPGYGRYTFFAESHADPFNHQTLMDLFFSEGVNKIESLNLNRFISGMILVDFLRLQPKLHAYMAQEQVTLITKDIAARFEVTKRVSRIIRYISLQPLMMYARMVADILDHPEVRLSIGKMSTNFYNNSLFVDFKKRTDQIGLGDVYNHIVKDCSSGLGITKFGEHNVLRFPLMIARMFSDLNALIQSVSASVAVEGSSKEVTQHVAIEFSSVTEDVTRFMREFLTHVGFNDDKEWAEFSEFNSLLGYVAPPRDNSTVDYLNPLVIISDGYTSTDPVGYAEATRAFHFTPLLNNTGGPEKTALTYDPRLTQALIGTETSVRQIVKINADFTTSERNMIGTLGVNSLGKNRPVLWVVRHADYHTRTDDELRLALMGRLPSAMYNGDPDVLRFPHTTFEDFANDIGMSPEGLISLINPTQAGEAGRVGVRVKAMVRLFFTVRTEKKAAPSIFQPGSPLERIIPGLDFASSWYFVSKRSTVLQYASSVSLQPMVGREALTLTSRESGPNKLSRKTQVYVTIVAEPWQPLVHADALGHIVSFDDEWAKKWDSKFPTPNI
jgi:hypothetical protein